MPSCPDTLFRPEVPARGVRMSRRSRASRSAPRAHRVTGGFTLVEVLVALAILAIALTAVLRTMGQSIDLAAGLRARTIALWAAEERATEHLLQRAWPAVDTTEGTMEFGGSEWRWREQVTAIPTPVGELRRADIEIRAPGSPDVLGRISVVLRKP